MPRRRPTAADSPVRLAAVHRAKRRRVATTAKGGLRHFSLKVCEKVQEKNQTTYAEVADELVGEITAQNQTTNPDAVPAPVRAERPVPRPTAQSRPRTNCH